MNQQTTPTTGQRVHWVFWGHDGLRAGWGILLFVVLYILLFFLAAWPTRSYLLAASHTKVMPAKLMLILELVEALPALIATAVMARIERRKFTAYGLHREGSWALFVSGLFWGVIALSALILILYKAHFLVFDGQSLHGLAILKYAAAWAVVFFIVAVFEETTLRGYLQYTLTRGIGFWGGAFLLSVLFGFGHSTNPGESPVGLYGAAAVGLVFCLSLWYTGSLWWALGFHAAWDWAQSYFYGTSDSGVVVKGHLFSAHPMGQTLWSGGQTGPEGSVITLAILACIAGCMVLWWGRRGPSPFHGSGWRPAWTTRAVPIETEVGPL